MYQRRTYEPPAKPGEVVTDETSPKKKAKYVPGQAYYLIRNNRARAAALAAKNDG